MRSKKTQSKAVPVSKKSTSPENALLHEIASLIEAARANAARSVNTIMTATYWEIGRRIIEFEQGGQARGEYGEQVIKRLAIDLTARFGRGFGRANLFQMRAFYLTWREKKVQTVSGQLSSKPAAIIQTTSGLSNYHRPDLPLPWSHYVRLLSVKNDDARMFYETEALKGGWSIRQLDRQISTQFYERVLKSKIPETFIAKGSVSKASDHMRPEEAITDPLMLEFLGLKDEYSESELEEALIQDLQTFLLELGSGFAFIGRQQRLRIGNSWYRVDLVFFHRTLKSLVLLDIKIGAFSHADAGQMNLYLNYARTHWMQEGENPPVGIILCTEKDDFVVEYALGELNNKILATKYETALPSKETLAEHLRRASQEQARRLVLRQEKKSKDLLA